VDAVPLRPGRRGARPNEHTLEVTVNIKKIVAWLIIAFAVFYVIQAPEQSAQLVRNAGTALGDAAASLASFVGSLV
jgi:large-conductance mechanosensitive channel